MNCTCTKSATARKTGADTRLVERDLPSGRHVVLSVADGVEQLEVRSPAGAVEVRIELTDRGPVVKLSAAELQLGPHSRF